VEDALALDVAFKRRATRHARQGMSHQERFTNFQPDRIGDIKTNLRVIRPAQTERRVDRRRLLFYSG